MVNAAADKSLIRCVLFIIVSAENRLPSVSVQFAVKKTKKKIS